MGVKRHSQAKSVKQIVRALGGVLSAELVAQFERHQVVNCRTFLLSSLLIVPGHRHLIVSSHPYYPLLHLSTVITVASAKYSKQEGYCKR